MKRTILFGLLLCSTLFSFAAKKAAKEKEEAPTIVLTKPTENLTNQIDSVSYALGINIGEGLQRDIKNLPGEPINYEVFLRAFSASIKHEPTTMNSEEAVQLLQAYFSEQQKKKQEAALAKERDFLEKNAQRPGILTTESGLQYEVITMGNGAKPKATDRVKVHYHGTLSNGEVFDSSVERGEPAVFNLGGVIKGWTEILQMMPVGSKWIVTIPSKLAYGERGAGQMIGPNEPLIFEIELLGIE